MADTEVVAKKELTERQKTVLQWINDGCPDNDWPETYYKGSARMMASYDLVKIKGRGKEWQAQITQRGRDVLAGVEALTGSSRVKYRAPRRDLTTGPTATKPATPKKIAPPAPPTVDTEQLFEELLAAEFQVITRPLATDDEEARWKDELRRLRSSRSLLGDAWRVTSRVRNEGSYHAPQKFFDLTLVPVDKWLSDPIPDEIKRYHPAVGRVMKYSTNMTRDLQKRAKRALHMLFREVEARGWEHKEVDVSPYSGHKTARERGSLNPRDTGYGFNDGHRDYFVSATEQVDIVQREPTKQELEDHERDLRWWPNARIKKFYDHPYTGNLTITIGKYQAKDSITRTAETSMPAVFAQITLSHCWVDYDREMSRRARELWDKKVAIAEKRADEIIRSRQFHEALQERSVEWEEFKAIQRYVEDLTWIRRWSFGDRLISAAGTTKIFGQE